MLGQLGKLGLGFWLALAGFAAVVALYLLQPDATFALTIYSPWAPGLAGFFFLCFAAMKRRNRSLFGLSVAWLIWGLAASEEIHAFFRTVPDDVELGGFRFDGKRLRIVSLNCEGGSLEAAQETQSWKPDIVLLQESPSKKDLQILAKELFGPKAGLIVGPDASILSRFPLASAHGKERPPTNFTAAFAKLDGNQKALVVSLRLAPPVLRFDYWNPECWGDYARGRAAHRDELQALMRSVAAFDDDWPMIVGGDFNGPPDRSLRTLMEPRLQDAARVSGSGWTMTAVNEFPLVRIDQIWVDARWEPLRTVAVTTLHSDHRMVVCDVMMSR